LSQNHCDPPISPPKTLRSTRLWLDPQADVGVTKVLWS
jgi:hypothetical protein